MLAGPCISKMTLKEILKDVFQQKQNDPRKNGDVVKKKKKKEYFIIYKKDKQEYTA